MPIDRTVCKLMTEDRARSYDVLEAQFRRVEQGLPQLWSRKEMQGLATRLARLKEQMERPRYYVGFLGRSQVGKSSTLNSILKAPPDQGPGTGGAGAPMTSNITRLYRLDPSEGEGHKVTLRFMTPAQFKRRRDDLYQFLGYRGDQTDDAVLANLDDLIRRERDDPETATRPPSEKSEDRRYLAMLLRSYKAFSHLVTDPPKVQPGDYAKRREYTNHPRTQDPWPYLLLAQVEIGYWTEAISPKIELIDLPGLGARLFSDDLLTETFLPQLDGALVFQSSEQVKSKEAYNLLAKLGERFRRMEGRVWMIFTKFDSLAKAHYGVEGSGETILDNIADALAINKVPAEQVLLVGNEFHRKLLDPEGQVCEPTPDLLRGQLNLDLDEDHWILPPGFAKHERLAQAFAEVVRDGGIGRVRRVIGEELERQVEAEVGDAVYAELGALRGELARLVRSAEEAARMDSGGFRRAVQWKVKLQEARQSLDRDDRAILETPTVEVMEELRKEFIEGLCPPSLSLARAQLRTAHKEYARVLQELAVYLCRTELVPAVFGWVTERLRAAYATLGDVRLNGAPNPLRAWEERKDADLAESGWLTPLIAFDTPPLFPSEDDDVQLLDRDYREAIPRKVENVCRSVALAVSHRIKWHIDEMIDGLTLLKGAESRVDAATPVLFQEILRELS